jgi:phospholipid N-methyltransferase
MKGLSLFLKEILLNPMAVGAAWPSSQQLAHAMTKDIQLQPQDYVLELGAGTGVITEALLMKGIPPERLIVLERSPALAQHLHQRFPQITIIQGDALQLATLIKDKLAVRAIVSGLPLRSWSSEKIEKIGKEFDKVLLPNGLFIQFTYGLFSKPLIPSAKLQRLRHQYILWNLPPARIDVFRHVTN